MKKAKPSKKMSKKSTEVQIDLVPGTEFDLFTRAIVGVPKAELQIELHRQARAKTKKK
jgi:hypothetical protein